VKAVTDSLCPTYYDFLASAENVPIEPDVPARVVINERTGTVVVGSNVRLTSVAITHGSLAITITPATTVSQPPPLSPGQTVTTTVPVVEVEEEKQSMMVVEKTPDVGAIAKALNDLGVKPRDVVAIFQALKEAGALQAELIII
jgi:flagellar P-ring protein precursor FlgI